MSIATTIIVASQAHKHKRGENPPELENIPSYGTLALVASLLIAAMGLLIWLG